MKEEQKVAPVNLDITIITLQSREIFKTKNEAEKLARATKTKLGQYNQMKGGCTQAYFYEPLNITATILGPEGQGYTSTEIMIEIRDDGSLKDELEQVSQFLEQAMRINQENAQDGGPNEKTILRTAHFMSTDRIPDGQPEELTEDPITERFLTSSGQRCLNTITWRRDRELEQVIMEQEGKQGPQYQYRSESITTVPSTPDRKELFQVLMSTYTTGARFLLRDIIKNENEECQEPP